VLWVIPREFIHTPKNERLINKFKKLNQCKKRDLCGNPKRKKQQREGENFTII